MSQYVLVLDANFLQKDWHWIGARSRLLRYLAETGELLIRIPAPVVQEVHANFKRNLELGEAELKRLNRRRGGMGLPALPPAPLATDWRARLDEVLTHADISISSWPDVPHEALVERAVERRNPFDDGGGGYRDALVWLTALKYAEQGFRVALVSEDKAFRGPDEALHPDLAREADGLLGSVELVRDMHRWLPRLLPWPDVEVREGAELARDGVFTGYLDRWSLVEQFPPHPEDLELPEVTADAVVQSVTWDGTVERVAERGRADQAWVTYDVGMTVEVEADLLRHASVPEGWTALTAGGSSTVRVAGSLDVIATVVVFHDGDDDGLDSVAFRPRGLGSGPDGELSTGGSDADGSP